MADGTKSLDVVNEDDDKEMRIILVGDECRQHDKLKEAVKFFNCDVLESETGEEFLSDTTEFDCVFVLSQFKGEIFDKLRSSDVRIVGPPVIIRCSNEKQSIPYNSRPLYCVSMEGLKVCYTGFKDKADLCQLVDMVHYMGGNVRRDFKANVTHLVANTIGGEKYKCQFVDMVHYMGGNIRRDFKANVTHLVANTIGGEKYKCQLVDMVHYMGGNVRRDFKANVTHLVANTIGGEKYKYAVGLDRPIMSRDWISRLWTERDSLDFNASDPALMKYKLLPFHQRCLSFLGFSKEEQKHMEEVTVENGGTCSTLEEEDSTHLIVEEGVKELPTDVLLPQYVVRGEWFWACIQMAASADEQMYRFQKTEIVSNHFTPCANMSGSKSRKRKRLKENIAQLASDEELESPIYNKRRSSDMGGIISPNSFLDASNTPDLSDVTNNDDKDQVKITQRLHVVKELLQTEKNYVGILETILTMFKAQIEKQDQYNGAILAAPDVKLIFGNIPPIYDIHCKILEELTNMIENWHEEQLVGNVITENADALIKAYPPFVNFFEDTKERIQKCDKSNPRFHAFLKVCQTKKECGRQTLTELLIRPVQRLPSMTLLLNDIMKRTSKTNPDYNKLEKANNVLKEVMTHINEDKRKTESQVVMFDIMKDIENCPATLISSHRSFITRLDVIELSETLIHRGAHLSLFLFSDSIVICKRRVKVLHSKSPAAAKTPQKGYKHIEFLQLQFVKRVLDIIETEDCKCAFGLIVKNSEDLKEKLFTFMVDDEEANKSSFMTQVSKGVANTLCRTEFESLISTVEGHQLQVNTQDLGNQTFSKAASRFSRRVSRAFSFNKTPRRIKRAVSHVFSPFVKDSSREFTPGDLQGKRLASAIDLTEDTVSLADFYDDSDTVSLGAFSLKDPLE